MASMIASESIRIVLSAIPIGPRGSRTIALQPPRSAAAPNKSALPSQFNLFVSIDCPTAIRDQIECGLLGRKDISVRSSLRPRRRRHEFRADRIGDRFAQNPIDLSLGRGIEPPASHLVDRLQLTGMTRAPQRRGYTLIEHPADGELDNVLAEALLSELVEPLHRREILREPGIAKH